ncbi:hypothetical protein B0H63DRAFT_94962 [Podospora didyma]|uniref:Uncharacterized protein n=1 Tax=Podospora didyma TaxID=330526 RepID=A0AAE0NWX8_9PEZI|nr:hypothetical protein B0H63DRAFT_94962 [Podospora didyma]
MPRSGITGPASVLAPSGSFRTFLTPEKISTALNTRIYESLLGPDFTKVFSDRFIRIFAILVVIDRTERLRDFIESGVTDNDLPVPEEVFQSTTTDERSGQKELRFSFFAQRRSMLRYAFTETQWKFCVPYFGFRGTPNHYQLESRTILPLTRVEAGFERGSFGNVQRIMLDPYSYDFALPAVTAPASSIRNSSLINVSCLRNPSSPRNLLLSRSINGREIQQRSLSTQDSGQHS